MYDLVPLEGARLASDVIVGGDAFPEYDDVYDPESIVRVREIAVTVKLIESDVAAEYPSAPVIDAVIVQVPASTKVTAPELEPIVHTDVVELE